MSYLDLPRICFGGTWTGNVATGNNQPYVFWGDAASPQQALLLDFANVKVLPVDVNGTVPTDPQLRQMMNDENIKNAAGKAPDSGANWCYWGMNSAAFDTAVTAVNLGDGNVTGDPLVGKPAVYLNGELCDSNPSGAQATQIFSNGFNLAGVTLAAERTFSRWVWFTRNTELGGSAGASGVFEGVVTVTAEQWQQLLATGSPAIAALHDAYLKAGDAAVGLSVRFGLYASVNENAGETTNRPGLVSGAVGVATANELNTFPDCRVLYNYDYLKPYGQSAYGPLLLKVNRDRKVISLDLFSALKEKGASKVALHKVNVGPLALSLSNGTESFSFLPIGYNQYDMNNTRNHGSIVELSYAGSASAVEAMLDAGWSFILGTAEQADQYIEGFWAQSDQRNYYLDNGNSGSIRIKVMENGHPVAHSSMFLQQYIVDYAGDDSDVGGDPVADTAKWLVNMPSLVTTDVNGYAVIPLTAQATGNCVIRFTLQRDLTSVNPLTDGFANIRVLPTDDYSGVTDDALLGQAGFDLVFEEVLRFFYLTYPVMQPIMDFSNYTVMTSSRMLLMLQTVTDPAGWWSAGYMPRTRDLSGSRHELLVRWARVNYAALYGADAPTA